MTTSNTKKSKVKQLLIENENVGQRIDNYLMRYFSKMPKSRIYQMLRKGEVRVNKGRIRQTYRLQIGDCIRIPPVHEPDKENKALPSESLQKRVLNSIIYEDDDLLILNKPSNIAVHSGSGQSNGIIEAIRSADLGYQKLELVHRLDKETSGCLMLAKGLPIVRQMHSELKNERIQKSYLALLAGRLKKKEMRVDYPLRKNMTPSKGRQVMVDKDGKTAITHFFRERVFDNATLTRVVLVTGRTHQIRVHSAAIGHPIIGDRKYGDKSVNQAFKQAGLKRLFLHANRLIFISPSSKKTIRIDAPLSPELEELLDKLHVRKI